MISNLTEQEIRTFVGPKADYYLKKWRLALEGSGSATGFNWAAFFLSGMWLAYRRMYRFAAIFFGIFLLEGLIETVVYVGILGRPEAPMGFGRVLGFVASLVCGALANQWYFSHARETISEVRSQPLSEEASPGDAQ
jgi:Protein of unknown function (DUF2628)